MQYFKFTTCSCWNAKCLAFSNFFQSNNIVKLMLLFGHMHDKKRDKVVPYANLKS